MKLLPLLTRPVVLAILLLTMLDAGVPTAGARPAAAPSAQSEPNSLAVAELFALKAVHSLIWFGVEACMGYLLYAGIRRRWDRRTTVAALVVAGETLVFGIEGGRRE